MSAEPYDRWADDARSGLLDTPAAMQLRRRGDRPADIIGSAAELRARATRRHALLVELTGEPETFREVDDEDLPRFCKELERRIGEAKGKR